MAGIKISALPQVPSAQLTDIYPVVQSGTTYQESISQLVTLIDNNLTGYVPIAGGTMTGPLILSGDAILPLGAVTLEQLQTVAAGLSVILAVQASTTTNLNATPAGAGIGATLTNAGAQVAFSTDGYSANLNDRILVKNQTLQQHNGIYSVTTVGTGASNWVLTRSTDYDTNLQIVPGTLVPVINGTLNAGSSWVESATVVTVDTDPVIFSQFSYGASSFLVKANNLSDLASVPTALVNLGLGVPTGTGNVVLQTSPTLITPVLGAATATTLQFSPSTGGIIGTTTNNNASAGIVGEVISSVVLAVSSVNLVNDIPTNITQILLTAGDWDVNANYSINGSTTNMRYGSGWISTTSATIPNSALGAGVLINAQTGVLFGTIALSTPFKIISIAVSTTVYLTGLARFTGGSVSACGGIYARRVR